MKRRSPARERGAALLAVLLLVAVTGAIAASMVESLRLSRGVALNAAARDQGRLFADGVGQLALLTIDDRILESPERTTLAGGWNGATRTIQLPGGGSAEFTVRDGMRVTTIPRTFARGLGASGPALPSRRSVQ